jgi:hypothetical protein
MHKRLLQVIALILVMTAALNAQCFATCAITPDHACCPHHKSAHADSIQGPALPVALAFEIAPQLIPAQVTSLADFTTIAVLPPPNRPALNTTLRL